MVLVSLAPLPPGMLLLQHRCQQVCVCVHRSWGFLASLCLVLQRNDVLSSAQGLSPLTSLFVCPHASLDFQKKSPCPATLVPA